MKRRRAATALLAASAAGIVWTTAAAQQIPNDRATIAHVVSRVTFGARPGDVDQVERMGLAQYLEQQLAPSSIADADVERRLARFTTIQLSESEIARRFELPLLEARRERRQQAQADSADANAMRAAEMSRGGPQLQANLVLVELSEQKLLRAAYSERQLEEVLVDFWFNHFNVDARKGRVRFMVTSYERDAIRPHVLGRFRDLLGATAHSPAMLFYLDNWMSGDAAASRPANTARPGRGRFGRAGSRPSRRPAQPQGAARRGLNENYARELLELHTLGVDGGYTQKDVTEVARAFTGWTLAPPMLGGGFRFQPQLHDDSEKTVLGRKIPGGGGVNDGEQVLDLLAAHPSTARFVATKLARRFVSDTPPQALIARAASRFTETKGDLREVMRTVLTSPELLGAEWRSAKAKTPLEFVVSAVRAAGAEIVNARPLVRTLQEHGMPLYQCQPPTGYKDTAAWINTGALVNRMNFATALTGNQIPGVRVAGSLQPLAIGGPDFQRR